MVSWQENGLRKNERMEMLRTVCNKHRTIRGVYAIQR